MARFNVKSNTVNYEDAPAFNLDPKMALYNMVCNSLLQPQFYRPDTQAQLDELRNIIRNNDPLFVAKLAVYARKNMNLRTIPLVLLVELARSYSHNEVLKKAVAEVISRPDEILELLAYYAKANDRTDMKKLSCQLKKGIKLASNKFDEYQYAKWNRKGGLVTLKQALKLTRPIPKDEEQSDIFHKVCSDSLEIPYTWESEFCKLGREVNQLLVKFLKESLPEMEEIQELNSLGKIMPEIKRVLENADLSAGIKLYDKLCVEMDGIKKATKKEKWEELIDSKRLGYQATLMNLRNLLKYDVSMEHIKKAANFISNRESVLKSKMFPFRYLSAYRALHGNVIDIDIRGYGRNMPFGRPVDVSGFDPEKVKVLSDALEAAAVVSINNVDMFVADQDVLIACDVSSSMFAPVSKKSTIANYDIGLFLGLMLKKKSPDSTIGIFGDSWKVKDEMEQYGVIEGVHRLYGIEGEVGYSTNGFKVLEYAIKANKSYDRIMMFTDGQMYDSGRRGTNPFPDLWAKYKESNPKAKLYLFNLAGYRGQAIEIGKNDVYLIAGWSNEIFNVLQNIENGKSALENINSIEL